MKQKLLYLLMIMGLMWGTAYWPVLAQILRGDKIEIPRTPENAAGDISVPGLYLAGDADTGIGTAQTLDELIVVAGAKTGGAKDFRFNTAGFMNSTSTFARLGGSGLRDGASVYCSDCAAVSPCAGSGNRVGPRMRRDRTDAPDAARTRGRGVWRS